ncbi:MAG: YchJ family protein [Myxococcota bacterium]
MSACPCGGGAYASCCGPRHDGSRPAETAEALMRSRYSAFARADVDYLARTQLKPSEGTWAETKQWAASVTWLSLEIVERERGGVADDAGVVEFIARYLEGDRVVALRERSTFVRRDGAWIYDAGKPSVTETRVERNQPCPCGSGRKFKQCHA